MKQPRDRVTFTCPVCGEDVEVGSPGCRECGSTNETGWSPDTEYDGLDLPDRDEDENDETAEPRRYPVWAIVTAVIVLIASIVLAIR